MNPRACSWILVISLFVVGLNSCKGGEGEKSSSPPREARDGESCESMCEHALKCIAERKGSASGQEDPEVGDEALTNCASECRKKLTPDSISCWASAACEKIESELTLYQGSCPGSAGEAATVEDEVEDKESASKIEKQPTEEQPLDVQLGLYWEEKAPTLPPCPEGTEKAEETLSSGDFDIWCHKPNGTKHGPWSRWHARTKSLYMLATYDEGEPHGAWTTWDADSGTKLSETHYFQGTTQGPSADWEKLGRLTHVGLYVGGEKHGRWIENFDSLNGNLYFVGSCYEYGKEVWRINERAKAWPDHGAILPKDRPDFYERPCEASKAKTTPISVAATEIPFGPWQEGSKWTYKVTREGIPGAIDEGASLTYYMTQEVTSAQQQGDGLLVKIQEQGGPDDKHVRELTYQVTKDCIQIKTGPKQQQAKFCLSPTGANTQRPFAESFLQVQELTSSEVDINAWIAPDVGLSRIAWSDSRKRRNTSILVGYQVGSKTGGRFDVAPLTCDWNNSTSPQGGRISFDLSGTHGYRAFKSITVDAMTLVRIEAMRGEDYTGSEGMELAAAKSWLPQDKHAEYPCFTLKGKSQPCSCYYN